MKVKCSYCGKKYDNITNNNQCPVCGCKYAGDGDGDYIIPDAIMGNYGSGVVLNDEPDLIEDAEDEEVLLGEVEPDAGRAVRARNSKKNDVADKTIDAFKKFWYVFFCVVFTGLVIIMDLAFFGLRIGKEQRKKKHEERQEQLEIAEESPIDEEFYDYEDLVAGQPIFYTNYYDDELMIYIKGVKVFEDTRVPMPEGYEVLELSYAVDDGKGDSTSNIYGVNIDTFILTKTGMYIEPLSYEIDDLINYDGERYYESNIGSDFDNKEGKMYFVVKANDADDLLLECKHRGEDYNDNTIERKIYIRGIVVEK